MQERFIVIMAGGRGERFWPVSRVAKPKHLLPIVGDTPMLRQSIDRLGSTFPASRIFVITNVLQAQAIRELCPELPAENIVAEPVGRDTAPAVALATALVKRRNPNGVFAMLPADHVVRNETAFQDCLNRAFEHASKQDDLVTIGIVPTHPATGYGYVEKGAEVEEGSAVFKVERFVEKPDLARAREYVESGRFFWNAGMFVWSVRAMEQAFQSYCPDLSAALDDLNQQLKTGQDLQTVLEAIYPGFVKISIDFAVMEKAKNVVMIESCFDWDDVGEWLAVERHGEKDGHGNLTVGKSALEASSNNLIYNDGKRITALLGVEDLIVVHTPDATLVCHKSKAQQIKEIVKQLDAKEETRSFL